MRELVEAFGQTSDGDGQEAVEEGALIIGALALAARSDSDEFSASQLIAQTKSRLDDVAENIQASTPNELMLALFGSGEFSGNIGNYYDPDNSLLPVVIDRRRGNPITLSALAMAIGRRANLRLEGVSMPGHFLLASPDARGVWFDPFHAGAVRHHDELESFFRQLHGESAVLMPEYLHPVGPSAILGRMLNNLRLIYSHLESGKDLAWVGELSAALRGAN